MLQERPNVTQHSGEPRRRFFFDDTLQLYVWSDEQGRIVAFELSYDLSRDARAFRWQAGHRMAHYRIDDGESKALRKAAPILRPDSTQVDRRIGEEFSRRSGGLETEVAAVVQGELDRFLAACSSQGG